MFAAQVGDRNPGLRLLQKSMIWLSLNRDFLIALSFFEHHKIIYSKPRLFFGGITAPLERRAEKI